MDESYQLTILLTNWIVALLYLLFGKRHGLPLLLWVAAAWILEGLRAGVHLAAWLNLHLPPAIHFAVEGSSLLAICFLTLAILNFTESTTRKGPVIYVFLIPISLFVTVNTLFQESWARDSTSGHPELVPGSELILALPAGIALILIGGKMLRLWSGTQLNGTIALGAALILDGLATIGFEIQVLFGINPEPFPLITFLRTLIYSVLFLQLVLDREWAKRDEAEAKMKESQRATLNLTRDFPGMAYRCSLDKLRTMRFISPGIQGFLGYQANEVLENRITPYSQIMIPEDIPIVEEEIQAALLTNRPVDIVYRVITSSGTVKWAWERGRFVRGTSGQLDFLEGFISDISQLRETEIELEETNNELKTTVGKLEHRAKEMDLLNRLGETMMLSNSEEDLSIVIRRLAPQLFPDYSGAVFLIQPERKSIRLNSSWGTFDFTKEPIDFSKCEGLKQGGSRNGQSVCENCGSSDAERRGDFCVSLQTKGETLGIVHFVSTSNNHQRVSDSNSVRQTAIAVAETTAMTLSNLRLRGILRDQAIRDGLTGLYNRRYFEDALDREIGRAARRRMGFSIIIVDLDHFKRFNDDFGHAAGDLVLKELGKFLGRSLRGEDIVCRFGGEEFVVLMPEISLNEAVHRAEDLRSGIERLRIDHLGQLLKATASIGVATYPQFGKDRSDIFEAADAALYKAKESGRNRVVSALELDATSNPAPTEHSPNETVRIEGHSVEISFD
ncbi:MAG: diguanylate cyclase [Acidobacteriota bacterium]|nr:MAG: diguanylate cyclase [Acidobacteriota bacterium]